MSKFEIILQISVIIALLIFSFMTKSIFILAIYLIMIYFLKISPRFKKQKYEAKNQITLQKEFITYVKNIIILMHTKTLKEAIKDSNYGFSNYFTECLNEFIEELNYDFSKDPYLKLADQVTSQKEAINYERHIMIMLYELQNKGLGSEYIDQLVDEVQKLEDNNFELKIVEYEQEEWKFNILPTIINFLYISFILMKIVNNIMKMVFTT